MSYLPTNSTNIPLLSNQEFVGDSVIIDIKFISVTCSFNSNVGGVLEFYHSIDGFAFSTYGDIFDFTGKPGSHSIEVSIKGKYFKIRYINGSQNQSVFNLFCKLNEQVAEAILNATYDSVEVYAGGENGFNTRLLTTDDQLTLPQFTPLIVDDSDTSCLNVRVNSMPPIVIPPISIGDVNIKDSNGNDILADSGTLRVSTISGFATSANQVTAQSSLNSLVTGVRIQASNGNNITVDPSNNLNVNVKNTSLNVDANITNDILVVDPIDSSISEAPYDLLINGSTLWADSTPLVNPFFADPNGREGWYYDNFSNIANVSNIYWYANPVSGNLQENDMTFAQLSSMYCIITPDYVDNGALTNPIMAVYSQPTGTNDFIPTFAHSRWAYSLDNVNIAKLRKAETIMLYTGSTRPQVHLNIPAYPLVLASTNGDALTTEIVAYMTVNTQATTSKIGYLLQFTGFLNSAIGFNREFQFKNSKERVIQNNQYSNSVTVNTISGFATETTQNSILTNTNKIKSDATITDAIQVAVKNTVPISGSVTVNTISGFATETTQNSILTNTNKIKSDATITDAIQVAVKNTVPISGSVDANCTGSVTVNTISGFATETTQNSILTNTNKIKSDATVPDAIQVAVKNTVPISGSVTVNTISGFATETTQNSILTNTNKIKSDATITDAIQVAVKNTVPISGSVNATISDIEASKDSISIYGNDGANNHIIKTNGTGEILIGNTTITVEGTVTIDALPEIDASTNSITIYGTNDTIVNAIRTNANGELKTEITNNITGFALETTQNSILTNTNKIKNDATITDAIQVAVKNTVPVSGSVSISGTPTVTVGNTSIDTRCYASSNGTTWHHLKSDATGRLNVHAMAQDGNGNDITSTVISAQRALDVNIAGGTVSISSVNIKDSSGNNINALTGPSNCAGAIKIALYGQQTDSAIGDTQTTYGSINKIGQNSFICNGSSEPVICGGYDGTNNRVIKTTNTGVVYTALDTSNNTVKLSQSSTDNTVKIDTSNNGIKLPLNTGTNTSAIVDLLIPSIAASQPGLLVGAHAYGRNIYNNAEDLVTVSTNYQVSNIWTGYDTYIRNGMTNNNITSGLNVYPINPIKISYTIGGFNSNTSGNANQCLGFNGTFDSQALTTTFGLNNPKYYWVYFATALESGILEFNYVNTSGVIVNGATRTVASANTWTSLFSTNVTIGGLLKYQKRGGSGASNQVEIAWTNTNVAPTSRANNIGTHGNNSYFLGLMTIPLGYTGIIKSISTYANTSTLFNIVKYEYTNNNRLTVWGTTNSSAVSVIYNPNIEIEEGCSVLVSKQGLASDVYYYAQIDLIKNI